MSKIQFPKPPTTSVVIVVMWLMLVRVVGGVVVFCNVRVVCIVLHGASCLLGLCL